MTEVMLVSPKDAEKFFAAGWRPSANGGYTYHHAHLSIAVVRDLDEEINGEEGIQ